jgi:hypothetical protein
MRIVVHTKYGVFEGIEREYDEEKYYENKKFLNQLCDLKYFSFPTDKGEIYLTKEMIADSLFILKK